jgi:hypothetical protein
MHRAPQFHPEAKRGGFLYLMQKTFPFGIALSDLRTKCNEYDGATRGKEGSNPAALPEIKQCGGLFTIPVIVKCKHDPTPVHFFEISLFLTPA